MLNENKSENLLAGLLAALESYPDRPALNVGEYSLNYRQLMNEAWLLASELEGKVGSFAGLLCRRGRFAYTAVLATVMSGRAYVPFAAETTDEKLLALIESMDIRILFVDQFFLERFYPVLEQLQASSIIFDGEDSSTIPAHHHVIEFSDCQSGPAKPEQLTSELRAQAGKLQADDLAYVLFTSGSTGLPKAVPISHNNICSYIHSLGQHYPLVPEDRCSQAFDLSFDPSVHDMFVTWFSGACLYFMDERARLGAQYFIARNQITVWNSIPSLVKLCLGMRSFKRENLSTLRRVFFNGEALQRSVVEALQLRVPEAELVNLYGLTETTVNLAHYQWKGAESGKDCEAGIVPLGQLFPGIESRILENELILSGEQVFSGYLNVNEEAESRNQNLFVEIDNHRFMRTGDLVWEDKNGNLHILGRNDELVKIRGKRVDLNAVRQVLEELSDCLDALVLPWKNETGDIELVGFVTGERLDGDALMKKMAAQLEPHMLPRQILVLDQYPYLVSGKVDKKKLLAVFSSEFCD